MATLILASKAVLRNFVSLPCSKKAPFIVLFIICSTQLVFSQDHSAKENQELIKNVFEAVAEHTTPNHKFKNIARPDFRLPEGVLSKLGSTGQAHLESDPRTGTAGAGNLGINNRLNTICQDTSYRRLLGVYNGLLYVESVSPTSDGGILVPALMYDTTLLPSPWALTYGLLIKLDADGNVTWIKQFAETNPGSYSGLSMYKAFELSNHDIICIALLNTNPNSDVFQTVIFRLTPSGDIIWQNCLKSNIGIFNSPPGTFRFYPESAIDGLNGDVILCGTTNSNLSSGKLETVVRLNNQGQLIWDANYGNHGVDGSYLLGAEGVSAFMKNGQIALVGLSHGFTYIPTPPAVNVLTLNYNDGALITKRFYKPSYSDTWQLYERSFSYWSNRCIQLSNGHFLFYGKLLADIFNVSTFKTHFGVIEFDTSFNLVNAYAIGSTVTTNYFNNLIHVDSLGRGLATVFEYISGYEANVYFGSFQNQQFQNQRKAYYPHTGMPGYNGFAFLNDGGYAHVQTDYESEPVGKSYFEFRKMHNSDTSSQCLGKDSLFFSFLPLNIVEDPGYSFLDPNEPNKMVALQEDVHQTDTISTTSINPCQQTNYCDTLKIHGNPVICGNATYIDFTAFKNVHCGGIVQWHINSNAIDSIHVLTDSSVRIWFQNANWQGNLYATLPSGACYASPIDSIAVSIIRSQDQPNLGPDTILCNQNSMILHAGSTYFSYHWQDGSTDSTLTVVAPGIYWVHVSDQCGNVFTDTVNVSSLQLAINIGPDRLKCNADTLHLSGPAGFLNYEWANNYNISSTTSQDVVVNPLVDTAYYLKAEKYPGCFAYDTVRIKVNTSPPISLGSDKSFCLGDSAILNAGNGFAQYQWSNGGTAQQIAVYATGNYSVTGTTNEGCRSYDTLRIINVWPNPVVRLDHNNSLCTGDTRELNAGNFSSYLWQNGSTGSSFVITGLGTYYVTVQDNNQCKGSDTVRITALLPVPAGFLPVDTAICDYGNLVLRPSGSFSAYLWSNNSVLSSVTITSPGNYWLQVKGGNDCIGRDSIVVKPKECLKGFYIPTAFTPDKNGRNDDFRPVIGGHVKRYEFAIYNRWGQVVFTTRDLNKGWDGTAAGMLQDTNVFAWICTYQLEGETIKTEKGTVVLIR